VLAHDRRRIVHFNVTSHTTAERTAQQLREAFPFDQAPQYLLRDRDRIFGARFSQQVADLGTEEVLGAPRSPWQRAYVERVIGTIRPRVPRSRDRFQRGFPVPLQPPERGTVFRSRKLAAFTTAMSGAPPERAVPEAISY